MSKLRIPSIRADVRILRDAGSHAVLDPVLKQRIGLDGAALALVEALSQARTAPELLEMVRAAGEQRLDPRGLHRHVRHLARHGLLEGTRAQMSRDAAQAADAPGGGPLETAELPLEYGDGLRHECRASGSCCSATDVGPITAERVAEIRAHPWPDAPGQALFRAVPHGSGTVHLAAMRHDQCVFLARDRLCMVHRELGLHAKPAPCRQFPIAFSRAGDRIHVSLQMECRDYYAARRGAPPLQSAQAEHRALLRLGAPVHVVPPYLRADPGLLVRRETYLELERRIVRAIRAVPEAAGPAGVVACYAEACDEALAELYQAVDAEEEPYLSLRAWRVELPGVFPEDPDPWENFLRTLGSFQEHVCAFTTEGAAVARERGLPYLAERLRFLERAVSAACGGIEPESLRLEDPAGLQAMMADLLVAALHGNEALRRADDLRYGLALVGMRACLCWFGAAARAKEGCRVVICPQDFVDTMVTIGKMLREIAVLDSLRDQESAAISLFSTNLGVFVSAAAPRLQAPGGIL